MENRIRETLLSGKIEDRVLLIFKIRFIKWRLALIGIVIDLYWDQGYFLPSFLFYAEQSFFFCPITLICISCCCYFESAFLKYCVK